MLTRERIAILSCILAAAAAFAVLAPEASATPRQREFREVSSVSKPIYRPRTSKPWAASGRLAGQIKYPPDKFTFTYFKIIGAPGAKNSIGEPTYDGQAFRTEEHRGDLTVYEGGWIPPGKYRVVISAEGFNNFIIPEVEVKKGSDCIMDIDFGTHVYYTY